jgi:hypothetical protein
MSTTVIESIMEKLAKKIHIEVGPNLFSFICENRMTQIKPFIYITNINGKPIVSSVGDGIENANNIKIYIFNSEKEKDKSKSPVDLVDAFLRYGIRNVVGKNNMIKPIIYFKGIHTLGIVCNGNQENILREAACSSGAMKVYFV